MTSIITPEIQDMLDCVQEEAAEIIKAVSKMRRFGPDSVNPYVPTEGTKLSEFTAEVGDLLALFALLEDRGLLDTEKTRARAQWKLQELEEKEGWVMKGKIDGASA